MIRALEKAKARSRAKTDTVVCCVTIHMFVCDRRETVSDVDHESELCGPMHIVTLGFFQLPQAPIAIFVPFTPGHGKANVLHIIDHCPWSQPRDGPGNRLRQTTCVRLQVNVLTAAGGSHSAPKNAPRHG